MAFDKTGFTTYGAAKSGNAPSLYGVTSKNSIKVPNNLIS